MKSLVFNSNKGFTILELLISLMIGIIVITGSFYIYLAFSVQILKNNQKIINLEKIENISSFIKNIVDMSGDISCLDFKNANEANKLYHSLNFTNIEDLLKTPYIFGFNNESDENNIIEKFFLNTNIGKIVNNSDGIFIYGARQYGEISTKEINNSTNYIIIDKDLEVYKGDFLIFSNCLKTFILEVTNTETNLNDKLVYFKSPNFTIEKGTFFYIFGVNIIYIGDSLRKDNKGNKIYSIYIRNNSKYELYEDIYEMKIKFSLIDNNKIIEKNINEMSFNNYNNIASIDLVFVDKEKKVTSNNYFISIKRSL